MSLKLTLPEQLGAAIAPSQWLQLAASGSAMGLVMALDNLMIAAVDADASSRGDTSRVEDSAAAASSTPFHRSADVGKGSPDRDEDDVQTASSATRAAAAFQSAERQRALNDADNQEGGYLPCIGGDTLHDSKYTLIRELGQGESSKVWLARHTAGGSLASQLDTHDAEADAYATPEDKRNRQSPLRRGHGALFAIKVYRCEERLQDSMEYERALMSYVTKKCAAMSASGAASSPSKSSVPRSRGGSTTAADAVTPQKNTTHQGDSSSNSGGAGPSHGICSLRDDFVHSGAHGLHPCLVFDVLGPPVDWLMKEYDFQGIPLKGIIADILRATLSTLVTLEQLHVIHTDLKPENLLFVRPQADLSELLDSLEQDSKAAAELDRQSAERGDCEAPFAVRFIDFGLSYVIPPELRPSITVTTPSAAGGPSRTRTVPPSTRLTAEERELLHLGNYQKGAVIQTREYRAPEILLGTNFNTRADIWSLGCLAYELVTGQFLFDPKAHPDSVDETAMDARHLYDISTLIGAPPTSWLDRGHGAHTRKYFDLRTFKFKGPRALHRVGKIDLVEELLPFTARYAPDTCREEATAMADFVLKCVQWDPSKRAGPSELLQHPWLARSS